MNDPNAAISAPPPRYLLESDSEDEEGQGIYGSTIAQRPKVVLEPTPVSVRWTDEKRPYERVVVSAGQTSRYLKRKLGGLQGVLTVDKGGETIGHGVKVEDVLVVSIAEGESEGVWELAKALRESVQAEVWHVLTTYLPSMHIPAPGSTLPKRPPIRYLSTSPSPLEGIIPKLESPNFATGLPAALASLAVHPSSPLSSLTILSLPLPLSDIANSALIDVFSAILPKLAKTLEGRIKTPAASWGEADDEPFSRPGMGARKKLARRDVPKDDLSGMYM